MPPLYPPQPEARPPVDEPRLPPHLSAAVQATHIDHVRQRLLRGDYPLSPETIADALVFYGNTVGDLSAGWPIGRRATALMIDAIAALPAASAMGLQLALIEQLPDSAIASLLGTGTQRLAADRRAAFATLIGRLGS